jgi:type I restriction enzyme S subunit
MEWGEDLVLAQNNARDRGVLPEGWQWTTISDACNVAMGQSPPSSTYNSEGIGLPFYQGKAEFGDLYPTPGKWCSKPQKTADAGDVLISVRAPVGPTNLCRERSCIGRGLAALRPLAEIPSLYVLYLLRHIEPGWESKATGTTFSAISGQVLRSQEIPLAPLPEQHRIVAEIETHLTRLEAGVAALKRAQATLRRYKASVLKAACEGRLVPTEAELARAERRDFEPADALLRRILAERRATWEAENPGKKYQAPAPPDTSDLPELPEGWVWANVDQLLEEPMRNGRSVPSSADGFPVLRLTAIKDGSIDLSERKMGVWTEIEAKPYLVSEGDFFVARGSGSVKLVGRGGFVKGKPEPIAFPDTMIRIRVDEELCQGEYLRAIWDAPAVRDQIETTAHTTAGIYKINQKHIGEFIIPLPPPAEQHRIVAEVERRLSVVRELEKQVELALRRAERLRQAVLKRAFEGKLVPQDPEDEPASVLLERIRAERAAGKPRGEKPRQMPLPIP